MEVPREAELSAVGPVLRVVGEPADVPPGTQQRLRLGWCWAAEPAQAVPVASAVIDLRPRGIPLTIRYRVWSAGEHRHEGGCLRLPAPVGYTICLVLIRQV